ncbi:TonB-dependent receptor [Pseudochryseolinea flava]|uniref:TonB-dependent receptor n=1 Tax=Pseudochryseolinea flava TaxID=2059302 RepID=A0A364Y795_9BACT|nr:TonB-dependent receptor [Pseudochryseolinea flava]RAW02984.1 TonB-dependent receptor [Pseudochryseolinea flava]
MLKFFSAALFVLLVTPVLAQNFTLSGEVRDSKNKKALIGATVRLSESGIVTITDAFGQFEFRKLSAGSYTVVITSIGYEEKTERVDLTANAEISITLNDNFIVTDEVVVLATRADDKTPTTFTNVGKKEIRDQNFGQDLPFLLNWTPSVVTTSDAGTGIGYTGVRIRGSDATRINVTINGIPYNDSESLGTFWVDIPDIASSSQSVQIQRGVGTSTNGAGAFGASINLQTNTRNDLPYAEIISSAGSFKTFRNTLSFGTGLLKDTWVIDGRISNISSDGYIDRAFADLRSYYFSTGFYRGNTMLKAIAFGGHERTYQSWYGVPQSRLENDADAMAGTIGNEGWNDAQAENLLNSGRTFNPYTYKDQVDDYGQNHYQLHFSQKLATALTLNTSLHYTKGKGYYEEYKVDDGIENYGVDYPIINDDDEPSDNDTIFSTDIIRRRWLDNDFYGITFGLSYEADKLSSVLGGAWNRYEGDHFGKILWAATTIAPINHKYYDNFGDKRDYNIYWKNTYQFNAKLSGYVDVQYRGIQYTASGIENKQNALNINKTFDFFNPKIGFVFSPSVSQQLYASLSVANREPVRDDFVDAPGSTPKPERLINVETGYRFTGKNYMIHANYYLMDYTDQLVLTGAVNDVGASVRTNVDKSYRMGVELEGSVKLSRRFLWNANVTLSRNKIATFTEVLYDYVSEPAEVKTATVDDTDISFSPSLIAGSCITYMPAKGFEATLLSKYVGKQYLDNTQNDERTIDAYFVNDIRLKYTISTNIVRQISFSLLVNNVFDEVYESNGYTWGYLYDGDHYRENYYFPQAGRNFMGMLTLTF